MLRKIFLAGVGFLTITASIFAAAYIADVSVKNNVLIVKVSVDNEGAWLGCSINTSAGRRHDLEPLFVVGEDARSFLIPAGAAAYEVALWRKRYEKGAGPDKDNAWGRANGYYLWEELDRKTGSF